VTYHKTPRPRKVDNPEWIYAINKFTQDSITAGNWKAQYGSDGMVLFNGKSNGEHIQRLPPYVTSIKLRNAANVHLRLSDKEDKVVAENLADEKYFGAIITQDPEPTLQTMTIDVDVKDEQKHRLALYFLDWDNDGRRSSVEIFDLKTLKLLAPVQLVRNYHNGKYMVFEYSGSLRIRVNHVRGKNAALSGLFFDSDLGNGARE
jgi:hypothetical protein